MGCLVFLLIVALSSGAIWWVVAEFKEQDRQAAQERARRAQEEAEQQRDRAEQEGYLSQMRILNEKAIEALEATPRAIESAEQYLDRAERDFSDGAFAPFWDSVEKAAGALGAFQESVQIINTHSTEYLALSKKYRGKTEVFSVSRKSAPALSIAASTSKRMSDVVRRAQRNFEFSVIYE